MSNPRDRHQGLKERWPKGCAAPSGYVAWHEWARAQDLHGLKQYFCVHCRRYYFPQEYLQHRPAQICKVPP